MPSRDETKTALEDAFRAIDRTGTGLMSLGELRYVLTSNGEKLTEQQFDEFAKHLPASKEGQVKFSGKRNFYFPRSG